MFLSRGLLIKAFSLTICLWLSTQVLQAQEKTRILFVVDASGSMASEWENKAKFNIARQLLFNSIDSIQRANPQIEVGIRLFGHQSHKDLKNCEDTKLEIPFGKNN